jgi:lysophospholipase L1-like esterase
VIVLSIPDWGVTPFAEGRYRARIAAAIDEHNLVNRQAALVRGARYLDVTALSRERDGEPAMLAADGLHPSAAMYAEWAALALPLALDALAAR